MSDFRKTRQHFRWRVGGGRGVFKSDFLKVTQTSAQQFAPASIGWKLPSDKQLKKALEVREPAAASGFEYLSKTPVCRKLYFGNSSS